MIDRAVLFMALFMALERLASVSSRGGDKVELDRAGRTPGVDRGRVDVKECNRVNGRSVENVREERRVRLGNPQIDV